MTTEEYDELLDRIRRARARSLYYRQQADIWDERIDRMLNQLSQEDTRIAREALTSMHSASRKLVVGE